MGKIAIIGGGITGLAAAWELQQQGVDYVLLEGASRLGGKIITERLDGFLIEGAADSFLVAKPWAWQLCRELGLQDRLIGTNEGQRNVYMLQDGQLHPMPRGLRLIVPTDPDGLLDSPLLSEEGQRRMLAEAEIAPRISSEDESLAAFMRRRFGQEALEVFGELPASIYTGDPESISMQASWPSYLAMEKSHGSLIRAMLAASAAPPPPDAPKTAFVSLKSGVYELIETLQARLTGDVRLNQSIESIEVDGSIYLATGETIKAEAVIMAVSAGATRKLTARFAPQLSQELQNLRALSSANVSLGFKASDISHPLDGYGFVVSSRERANILACTWSSTKLAGRAPDGHVLLRVFIGGHRHPDDPHLSDEQLIALARAELQKVMGIEAPPVISRVYRWLNANPQYEVGHLNRMVRFRELCPPWLLLTGSAYGGVGIPDCVRQGREAARQALAGSRSNS